MKRIYWILSICAIILGIAALSYGIYITFIPTTVTVSYDGLFKPHVQHEIDRICSDFIINHGMRAQPLAHKLRASYPCIRRIRLTRRTPHDIHVFIYSHVPRVQCSHEPYGTYCLFADGTCVPSSYFCDQLLATLPRIACFQEPCTDAHSICWWLSHQEDIFGYKTPAWHGPNHIRIPLQHTPPCTCITRADTHLTPGDWQTIKKLCAQHAGPVTVDARFNRRFIVRDQSGGKP